MKKDIQIIGGERRKLIACTGCGIPIWKPIKDARKKENLCFVCSLSRATNQIMKRI